MRTVRKVPRAVVIAAPALVAFALGVAVAWRAEERSPGEVGAVDEEPLDPLSAAHGLVALAHPDPRPAAPTVTLPGARTPEALLRVVGERVTLVPYEGALASPGQVLEAGVANGVDRARLLAALLADAGHVAQVVQVEASAGAAHVHATATPRPTSSPPAALQAALAARVAELAPDAWERLSSERAWVAAAGRVRGERSVLRPGDLLRGAAGEPLVVERVVREERSVETWNLEVAGWHTYFVAGHSRAAAVWVHNACGPSINVRHVFHGEINARGRAVGFHHQGSIGSTMNARVVPGTRTAPNARGVYRASVEIRDPATGAWVPKQAQSTFFPDAWSRGQVLGEIRGAVQSRVAPLRPNAPANHFEGISPSGVRVGGYLDAAGNVNTAFPIP